MQRNALDKALARVSGEVYLFGSRTDDQKKGGDIDLLIFSDEDPYELSRDVSVQFFMECEEKIDVIVMNPAKLTPEQQAFLTVIEKVKLK